MGEGMATYLVRDLREGTKDVADYERYCYFVAGLVGKGLSQLFLTSGYERAPQVQEQRLEPMGAFLQVTNITRDYIEDVSTGAPSGRATSGPHVAEPLTCASTSRTHPHAAAFPGASTRWSRTRSARCAPRPRAPTSTPPWPNPNPNPSANPDPNPTQS